jgi:hypothetical protein
MTQRPFKVVAIVSAFNEADIIGSVLQHLIDEGVDVYLIDHRSTDDTVRIAETFLARGVLAIESFPADDQSPAASQFAWKQILARKEELSAILEADWFIHHDADEFRESPWVGDRLVDAIRRVDAVGYNAIDFALLNFWPTDDRFEPGTDPREGFAYYTLGERWDRLQIKCWKKCDGMPDLVSSGGHDVQIPNRRVFPIQFVLRHYPIRGQQHGERKVFRERRPRFTGDELEEGWHIQYASVGEPHAFIRSPDKMTPYRADNLRLALMLEHRGVEHLRTALEAAAVTIRERSETIASLTNAVNDLQACLVRAQNDLSTEQHRRADDRDALEVATVAIREQSENIRSLTSTVNELHAHLEQSQNDLAAEQHRSANDRQEAVRLRSQLWWIDIQQRQIHRLGRDVDGLQRELSALYASRSWRWTAVLRWLYERVGHIELSRQSTS